MIIHNFEQPPSLLDQFISEIRDKTIQTDAMRFRKNVERVGEILSYEMSKTLNFKISRIETPYGIKEMPILKDKLVLCSVLRAGLPLHQGILNYFDKAENAFISAYRYHPDGGDDFEVIVKYFASPKLDGKVLVLTDPMLATGKTLENVYKTLRSHGNPEKIHILSIIGSEEGVNYVSGVFPETTEFWTAAIDKTLTPEGYIVPGLGDAGDLAFGEKL